MLYKTRKRDKLKTKLQLKKTIKIKEKSEERSLLAVYTVE